jgi:hypothetical protein
MGGGGVKPNNSLYSTGPIEVSETIPLSVANPEKSAKRSLLFRPKR